MKVRNFFFILQDFYLIEEFEEEGVITATKEDNKYEIADDIEIEAGDEFVVRIIDTTIHENDIEVEYESHGQISPNLVNLRNDIFLHYATWDEYLNELNEEKNNLNSEDLDLYDFKHRRFEIIDSTNVVGYKQQLISRLQM